MLRGGAQVDYLLGHNGPVGTRRASYLYWGGGNILVDSIEIYASMNVGSSDDIHMNLYGSGGLLGTLVPAEAIGVADNYTFLPTAQLTLTAGYYYLAVEPDFVEGTAMSWSRSLDDSGGSYHSYAEGTIWEPWIDSWSNEHTYRVYGTVVPEPSTIALFLLGSSCLFARRNKNNIRRK